MKVMVLDGNSILNRAYYGVKGLATKEGFPTNAIYGFLLTLVNLKNNFEIDALAVAFDLKKPTFRHELYSEYKANRKKMSDDLFVQLEVIKELLTELGYRTIECEGFEADDILGTFAKHCENTNNECTIVTGDRDSLQLISKNVKVKLLSNKTDKIYTEKEIMEEYNLEPSELIDLKAIEGDSSDNIPGVKGIGKKGALDLIKKFKSIENIYNNIDTLDIKEGTKKKLLDSKDMAYLSKTLGTIRKDVPIKIDLEKYIPNCTDKEKIKKRLLSLEMSSMIKKLNLDDDKQETTVENDKENETEFKENLKDFKEILDISLTDLYFITSYLENEAAEVIFKAKDNIYICKIDHNFMQSQDYNTLKEILQNETINKYTHDAKKFYHLISKYDIKMNNLKFDSMIAAYIVNSDIDLNEVNDYENICNDLNKKIIDNNQEELFYNIEMPLIEVLYEMEVAGVKVDKNGIIKYGEELKLAIDRITDDIYNQVGYEFNINSPKQLGEALYDKLLLPKGKKTKSGYSTSIEVLENIKYYHPVVERIIEYRTLSKLRSTYCESIVNQIESDGRIHSNFNQTETRTGRLSSTEPNLQNIPVRTELGKRLRNFFVAEGDNVLIDADYSQIELRILAHLSEDERMMEAFNNNEDIHAITASEIFNIPLELVNDTMRNNAKVVNFGIIYGMSAFSLSKDISVSVKEAQRYIDSYFRHYPKVKEYMDNSIDFAKENGYVKTLLNRKRYIPELTSLNFNLRSFGERVARNMPIQGTSADIIKIAMIRIRNKIKESKLKSKLILQVHDELIIESPTNEVDLIKNIMKNEMENCIKLKVPLLVKISSGKTWFDTKM